MKSTYDMQEVTKSALKFRGQGLTCGEISNELYKKGFKTRNGTPINAGNISKILSAAQKPTVTRKQEVELKPQAQPLVEKAPESAPVESAKASEPVISTATEWILNDLVLIKQVLKSEAYSTGKKLELIQAILK